MGGVESGIGAGRFDGARKVWLELNRQGVVVARCTVERLMRELGISGARGQAQAAADHGSGRSRRARRLTCWSAASSAPALNLSLGGGHHLCGYIFRLGVYRVRDGFVRAPYSRLAGR